MARNNKRINKFSTYFDVSRNAKEKKKSVLDYKEGLQMTKESIKMCLSICILLMKLY